MASFQPDNILSVGMVCQGLDTKEAQRVWKPFLEWVRGLPQDYTITSEPMIVTFSARNWWDAEFLKKNFPTMIYTDSRPGAPAAHFWFAGDNSQVGIFMHGYDSVWLPASLLEERQRERLAGALFASSRHWTVSLHFNKGLGGAPADAVESAKDTAMNPAVLDAFALAIIVGGGPPAFPGIAGHEPDMATARTQAGKIAKSTDELRAIVPDAGSYVSEGNFFDTSWQRSYWGPNYPRLKEVKSKYDPDGLFFVHHGVGSEEWSADGFTRLR
jgi:hypothetical protein